MTFSLYDATVPVWQQTLESLARMVEKAQAHCTEHKLGPEAIIECRLAKDMFPFGFQVKSTVAHSMGAIEALRKGVYSPDRGPWPDSFAGLQEQISGALAGLAALDPAEINGLIGRDMRFEMGERRIDFTAEGFLMSFSLPNFFFHAVTTYDILRAQGLEVGKRDFLGKLKTKT